MGMAAEHDIYVAVLHDGRNVLAGQIILERMVHGNNAEVSLLGIVGCKIGLEPVERLVYNGLGCRIRLAAACGGVQLEQGPRVAVQHIEMHRTAVKRYVASGLVGLILLLLHLGDILIKVGTVIVVAAVVDNRHIVQERADILEPVRELILLRAGALYHIAGMQDKVRIELCNYIRNLGCRFKAMAVADNHKADLIRIFGQRAEVTIHSLSVLGLNLVGIGRTRSQIGQAGTIHVHALTLKLFALLYRNLERFLVRIARTVGNGGLHRFIQFPNDNHAVCFRGHQVRTRQEGAGIRPSDCESSARHQCCQHHGRQHTAEQPPHTRRFFSHFLSPFSSRYGCCHTAASMLNLLS